MLQRLVILTVMLGSISACGQKGPLFLPDDEQAEVAPMQTDSGDLLLDEMQADEFSYDASVGDTLSAEQAVELE